MGFFDWLRKREPAVPLPQPCYEVAYFILPRYAFQDLAKVKDLCLNTPTAAGPFFYFMAATMRKVEPKPEVAKQFHWHDGRWEDGREYFALEYPVPPPVDLSDVPIEQIVGAKTPIVLAPHFSAIVCGAGPTVQYFILGQAPMGGGTTLRCLLREGANCNLGPGPAPELSAFLDAVRERIANQG